MFVMHYREKLDADDCDFAHLTLMLFALPCEMPK